MPHIFFLSVLETRVLPLSLVWICYIDVRLSRELIFNGRKVHCDRIHDGSFKIREGGVISAVVLRFFMASV